MENSKLSTTEKETNSTNSRFLLDGLAFAATNLECMLAIPLFYEDTPFKGATSLVGTYLLADALCRYIRASTNNGTFTGLFGTAKEIYKKFR